MSRYWIHSAPSDYRDDLRECARADRCANPRIETADGKTTRLPALTPRAFCDSCRLTIAKALSDLPELFIRVHSCLDKSGQTSAGPVVSVSKSAPVPVSLPADELLRLVLAVLVSWEERVRAVANLVELDTDTSRYRRDGVALTQAWTTLATHLDVLLALPEEPMMRAVSLREAAALPPGTKGLVHRTAGYADVFMNLSGADAGIEILNLTWRCRSFLTDTRPKPRHMSGVPCDCGFCDLYEALDDDGQFAGATCKRCGNEYTGDAYRDLTKAQEAVVKKAGARRRTVLAGAGDDTRSRRA
ncbi:hypothetical protein HS041_12235 [Planomonospora sp. ID67723]|uniref:hypothetical protein n=1 Tax=Planomonospora sp. ID67723 TaxID=2738134 RepID=UPI0018C3CF14|nr:hypothetical protein [Planomonospora sp. ID67723]MBG0828537.1 hypothetical protein [Planomonospora sp. ID67723]